MEILDSLAIIFGYLICNLIMQFNERLKKTRIEKCLTQKDIYTFLKVSANCYASWEQGRTQPDIENIRRLCIIYNVSADYLIGLEDEYGNKTI